jgi:hypothetical protein
MKNTIFLALALLVLCACKKDSPFGNSPGTDIPADTLKTQDELLHLNEIQIIASHNSYRMMTTSQVFSFLNLIGGFLPADLDPKGLDYDHIVFDEQMTNYGVRGLEIDIYNDPDGGAFANRKINSLTGLPEASGIPELDAPGFKVLHIKDVDYNTHYYTFKEAIRAIKNWSDAHPNHLPIFINIESKEDSPADNSTLALLGFVPPPKMDASAADAIDQEIRDVFGNGLTGIITPDRLRGELPTLNDVVLLKKWPELGNCRGKILFIMEGALVDFYKQDHPSLSDRAMFVYAEPGTPEAVFVIRNDAISNQAEITQLVQQGYIVRTRCDAETVEARSGDYSRMYAAFTSGAQINSTDYYKADDRAGQTGWTNYKVNFPQGELGRKNPVNAANIITASILTE